MVGVRICAARVKAVLAVGPVLAVESSILFYCFGSYLATKVRVRDVGEVLSIGGKSISAFTRIFV